MSKKGEWRTVELTPDLQAFQDSLCDLVGKHYQGMDVVAAIGVLCNVAGRVIAMLPPGAMSDSDIEEFVIRNVQHGNKFMRDQANEATANHPLHDVKPKGTA